MLFVSLFILKAVSVVEFFLHQVRNGNGWCFDKEADMVYFEKLYHHLFGGSGTVVSCSTRKVFLGT
jgi:hypothetical protein